MFDLIVVPLALAGLGGSMLWLAWMALGEYRKMFLANPRLVMSFEVFTLLSELGGLGYVVGVLAFFGIWFILVSVYVAGTIAYVAWFL